jgi:hypothetical protein
MDQAPIEQILQRLKGVKRTANGWDALCPAHDDQKPSLGIAAGDDGTVLLKCRSQGCTAGAICQAIGLALANLFPAKLRNGSANSRKRVAATYDYVDAAGKLLYQVVRYEPKGFRQRRPTGKNAWIWNLKGVQRVLYRLPELTKAVAEGRVIFVVEGEKDTDRLWQLGLAATTNPGGAGKWRSEYSEFLRAANVVILPDADQPGQAHAEQSAASIHRLAASVKIVALPNLPQKSDVSDWLEAGGSAEQLSEIVNAAPLWTPQKAAGRGAAAEGDVRPTIEITTEEHKVNEQASDALSRSKSIYQRINMLVRIARDVSPAAKGVRRVLAPRIDPLPLSLLRERMAEAARWVRIKETQEGLMEVPMHPPAWSVSAVHARGHWPGIPHLEAVVDYPVLKPDGMLLFEPGYDLSTSLLLETSGLAVHVPVNPTRDDAVAARDALLDVVSDFPFEAEVYRASWLAALLTPLARFAFAGPAPLFLADANVRAAGKGLLLDCISRIVTGERFTVAAYTGDEDELRKRITSLVLAGDRLVLLDNLDGKFGNAVLDAALTGTVWKDRVLGVNRMAEAPLLMTWYATGNNVLIAADTARRICHIRLESEQERPEERAGFKRPQLLAWVGQNRARLLSAALTILRAYCAAGRPDQNLPAWGSFEGWSALVRGAVVWVGMADPGATRLRLQYQSDIAAESMTVLLDCLEKLDPDHRGLTAAEVIEIYKNPPDANPNCHLDLKDALEALLGKPDSRGLGNRLRAYRRRVFGNRFMDQAGSKQRAARWAVYPASDLRRRAADTHKTHDTHLAHRESGESSESIRPLNLDQADVG